MRGTLLAARNVAKAALLYGGLAGGLFALGLDVSEHRLRQRVEPNARVSRIAVENGEIAKLD